MAAADEKPDSRTRILDAALTMIRTKGYNATRVEDICEAAGLTKGGFFHHFSGKEDLAIAAANYWAEMTTAFFAAAAHHAPSDPLQRLLAYVDFRRQIIRGQIPEFTCLVGTMTQEIHDTHPAIREACRRSITGHADTLVPDIQAAMKQRGLRGNWTAQSLSLFTQATIQGGFILAKATGDPGAAVEAIDHLRRYIELLFEKPPKPRKS